MRLLLVLLVTWLVFKLTASVFWPHHVSTESSTLSPIISTITSWLASRPSLALCTRRKGLQLHNISLSGYNVDTTANFLALLLSGDVQLNPGPTNRNQSIFPYGYCNLLVDYGEKGLCCDKCDIWMHKSCIGMRTRAYSLLDKNHEASWASYRCKTVNSSLYHSYEYSVSTSNSFRVLEDITDDSVFPSPSGRPYAESSPIGAQSVRCPTSVRSTSSSILAGPPSSSCEEASSNVSHSITDQRLPGKGQSWRTLVVNINSIRGKVADLEYLLDYTRPYPVFISETKLGPEVNTQEVVPDAWGYTCYRKDRTLGGGGTMLLVNSCYISQEVPCDPNCENIWVEIMLQQKC